MKRVIAVIMCAAVLGSLAGCESREKDRGTPAASDHGEDYTAISGLDTEENVTLKIATVFETDKALDMVINQFMDKYPNVDIQQEYVEDYDTNAVELLRNNAVDMIFQKDMVYKDGSAVETAKKTPADEEVWATEDYFYNFAADPEIDFSNTTEKLMGNYTHTRMDEENNEITYQYSVPTGGEVRGMFVNETLLKSVGKDVPTNWEEFLDCCETLKQAGYVPIQGNAGTAAMAIMLASCVNGVVHDPDSLETMRQAKSGVSLLFEDSFRKMYDLATKRYYDYKYVEEELGQFKNVTDIGQAQSFLGLVRNESTFEYEVPENNYGTVAFFPYLSYLGTTIDRLIEEYQLDTEYRFIITPTNEAGQSPTYLTPYYGICGNKNSENLLWIREFVNFFFQNDMNKLYAENAGIIPNTADAISFMADKYGVDAQKDCSSCGDIYFSDSYNGYTPLAKVLVNTSKCGAHKYMVLLDRDENGEIQYKTDEDGREYLLTEEDTKIYKEYVGEEDPEKPGYAFCNFDYFMDQLETEFAGYQGS